MLDEEAVETWGVGDALKGEFQTRFELPKMSRCVSERAMKRRSRSDSRKRPPHPDDPLTKRLKFYALPDNIRRRHRDMERSSAILNRGDLMYDVALRDGGYRCAKCGCEQGLGLDHIRPISKGGKTELSNLQLLCRLHNAEKNDQIIDYRPKRTEKE